MGLDIVDIVAFREQLADTASAFAEKTFTEAELRAASDRPSRDPVRHLAARYAAKEALIKAWSGSRWGQTYLMPEGVDMRELEVLSDVMGRPALQIHGALADRFASMDIALRGHVSLSHDGNMAAAVVIMEPAPDADV